MKLGALADGTGFSGDELEQFTPDRIVFWWNCLMAWRKHLAELQKG